MNFILQRLSSTLDNGGSTQGWLFDKDDPQGFRCHTIEDEGRLVKVAGETRIPSGFYPLRIWNNGQGPNDWVLKHRAKYNSDGDEWFKVPIEVGNVPGFSGVLIHVGYSEKDTDGCLLLADTIGNNSVNRIVAQNALGAYSMDAVKRFYLKVYPALERGDKAFLEVKDENVLTK